MPLEFAYRIVDVFTDRPLSGNALCVVLDPVPEPVMQAIAREVNLSETTFPVVTGDGEYENRIFTPTGELPFAGHPTLGTAWVLGPGTWTQRTSGATTTIEVDEAGATMTQPDPVFTETDLGPAVTAAGLPGAEGAWIASAAGNRLFLLLTDAPIDRLSPDMAAVAELNRRTQSAVFGVVRRIDDTNLHVRVFCPAVGIVEDPGTGAAAGPIALLARQQWGSAADAVIRQGVEIGRPCHIAVHAEMGNLRVGGNVAACAKGHFLL